MVTKRLLVDLDGVLANFEKAVCDLFGADLPEEPGVELHDHLGVTLSEMWKKIKSTPDFWSSLPVLPAARRLWRGCKALGDTRACTSPGRDNSAASQKLDWLDAHGFSSSNAIITEDKLAVVHFGILIDDRDDNVEPFQSAGGTAVLFPARWNRERFLGTHEEAVTQTLAAVRQLVTGS